MKAQKKQKKTSKLNVFVSDSKVEIPEKYLDEYKQFLNEETIINNNLLGDYDKDGAYVLSMGIREELAGKIKHLTQRKENSIECVLRGENITLKLELVFSDFEEKSMVAKLYLIEKVYGAPLKTFVAEYISLKNYEFKQKAREAFNILLEDCDTLEYLPNIDKKNEANEDKKNKNAYQELPQIAKKVEGNKKKKNKERSFIIEMFSEQYVLQMVKLLEKCGGIGLEMLEEYKRQMKERGLIDKTIPNLYSQLRVLLNQVIDSMGGYNSLYQENPDAFSEVKSITKEFLDPIKEFDSFTEKLDIPPSKFQKMAEKKAEKTKSSAPSAKKGGGKSSGGKSGGGKTASGGGKAKAKKKEKKEPIVPGEKDNADKTKDAKFNQLGEEVYDASKKKKLDEISSSLDNVIKREAIKKKSLFGEEESKVEQKPNIEKTQDVLIPNIEIVELDTKGIKITPPFDRDL